MFDGFRPRPTPEKASASEREPAIGGKPDQTKAIERYARATADIGRMRAKGLPVLPHQEGALRKAGEVLDAGRPHAARDLASALRRDPKLIEQAAGGNTGGAARAMAEEQRVRLDPRRARAASWKPGRRCSGPAPPWSGRATVSALSGCAATWRRWPARSGATRSLNPRCAAARPSWR
jgi:hypothetical protein